MSIRKFNITERSHIAEELTKTGPADITRKCMVIQQVVSDGDFPLEEALSIYEVDLKDYLSFAIGNLSALLNSLIGKTASNSYSDFFKVSVLFELQKSQLRKVDSKFPEIVEHYKELQKKVQVKA